MNTISWGQKEFSYSLTPRQKNKVKGYEIMFYSSENMWGESLGFYKTKKECVEKILHHKKIRE